jgi:DNA mismatch repair ATPase MutL
VNTVDFFNQINLLYGSITEFCTDASCPVMSAGPKYEYQWMDGVQVKKPIQVTGEREEEKKRRREEEKKKRREEKKKKKKKKGSERRIRRNEEDQKKKRREEEKKRREEKKRIRRREKRSEQEKKRSEENKRSEEEKTHQKKKKKKKKSRRREEYKSQNTESDLLFLHSSAVRGLSDDLGAELSGQRQAVSGSRGRALSQTL